MILRQATIKYKGYDPLILTKGSHKRICVSCNCCGRIRYIEFRTYTNLCRLCANIKILKDDDIRKKISQSKIGKSRSEETKQKISNSLSGLNHWNYGKHLSNETKDKQSKSHIAADVIVYIPKELHKSINHNLKNGENMDKINLLSLQFIRGEL